MKNRIIISIVLYDNDENEIKILIENLNSIKAEIYIFDNSKISNETFFNGKNFHYTHNNKNLGFGIAHNLILKYHTPLENDILIILNPDIVFNELTIQKLINYFELNYPKNIAISPKIYDFNGDIQKTPAFVPNPILLFLKAFFKNKNIQNYYNKKYCLNNLNQNEIVEIDLLSGCFILMYFKDFKKIGGFNNIYFLYFEDWELSNKLKKLGKLIHHGKLSINHKHKAEARKKIKPFLFFIRSYLIYYFKKLFNLI